MPATIRTEFALALNQVATERGIEPNVVLETIKAAILAAYRKDYGTKDLENIAVDVNPDSGEARVLKGNTDITPAGFGRIAAQTAKQVILQRIREAEKKAIITDYSTRVGTITNGMVLRFDGANVVMDIGRAEGIMYPSDQIPGERYRLNQRLVVYIDSIRQTARGEEIIVSRVHKGLVLGLFQREVPEVTNGAVVIKEIAREPGARTKIAVSSTQSGVDPVGSCVGQKGVRVQAVINELGGIEKIDIVQWHEDSKVFIAASLAPAKNIEIVLNEKKKSAIAIVTDEDLSLAIGMRGQNVRLAARLTNWKIDIKARSDASKKQGVGSEVEEEKSKTTTEETESVNDNKKAKKRTKKEATS